MANYCRGYCLLKGFDKHGRRVFVFHMAKIDPNKFKIDDIYRLHYMVMEILMDNLDQACKDYFNSSWA